MLLRRAGFQQWYRARNRAFGRQRAVIVMYHSFTPGGWGAVAPATFRWHLELIRGMYEVVPLLRLVAGLANRTPTEHQVALTVDDGYEDFITEAYPILSEFRIPATLFVPTGFTGGHNDWEELPHTRLRIASAARLRELDPALVTLGSHSVHHRALGGLARERLDAEIRGSKSELEALAGVPAPLFSYPYGRRDHYTAETISAVREAGFVAAVTTRWDTYSSDRELMTLPRIFFREDDSEETVRGKVAGEWDWIAARQLAAYLLRSRLTSTR